MRKLVRNAQDTFRVKAYAGTNGVLLAFDVDESRRNGLLGFAVKQKEGNKEWQWLLNSLTFPGKAHALKKWKATPSNLAPIQKMRWADYSIAPRTTCRYRVHLVYGTPDAPQLDEKLEVEVRTDDGLPDKHRVIFNRAVAASQSFGRKFEDMDKWLSTHKNAPIEDWPNAKARDWLQHGLLDKIEDFVARARDDTWTLDVAIYEYELKVIVDAINAAHKRGVKVRILYHGRLNDEQTKQNEASVKKIPKARKLARITSRIFHNKFIVLGKRRNGASEPRAVLCGSTNFTENGVYRQANVVHVANDRSIAGSYAKLFQVIWDSPADVPAAKKWIGMNNAMDAANKLFVGFSPRAGARDLAEFVNCINAAQRDLLFATAFALPRNILEALLGQANDPVMRFGLQNSKSSITGFHADRTAKFVTPALLNKGLEGWVKEGLRGQKGNLLVHLKAIVVNFTGDDPIIISGSHNLSAAASGGNDENYLIMRGDTDLADRYGLEILRFYEHYRFRFFAKLLKLKQARPLAVDGSWADGYYTPGNIKQLERLRFAGR
jgi:phosphatidylserine/phosphatidylglycerophosphate/cardiolipin synthase-like enzyme